MTSFSFLPLGGGKAAAAVDSKHSKVFVDKVVSYFYETEIDLRAGWVVKVRQNRNDSFKLTFPPKSDKWIQFYYCENCFRSFFGEN